MNSLLPMNKIIDFAVVGGGIAGTYVAWRLAQPDQSERLKELVPAPSGKLAIHLFEATKRVGGRLLTVRMPGTSLKAELGGMRYTNDQLLVAHLVAKLGLTEKPFSFSTRLMYLRGRHLKLDRIETGRCSTCGAPLGFPYELRNGESPDSERLAKQAIAKALREVVLQPSDVGLSSTEVDQLGEIRNALRSLDPEGKELHKFVLSAKQWALLKRSGVIQNRRLHDLGFWNLLQHYLSGEAFLFVHDSLGYESVFANWNAAEAIPWFLSDFGVNYLTIEEGLEVIPKYLATFFESERPDCLHKEYRLVKIEPFVHAGESLLRLIFDHQEPVIARYVILALPKEPLKMVDFRLPGSERLRVALDSVTAHPLFKLFLGYEYPWWGDPLALGHASGRATTDLPIRQVYYFGPKQGESPAGDKISRESRAMLMASYSDEHYVDFWRPLVKLAGESPYVSDSDKLDEEEDLDILNAFGVTEPMALKAHRQILQLHPDMVERDDSVPVPYVGLVMNWGEPPFYGGWHSWEVHTEPWRIVNELKKPFSGTNLYICGEAYSLEQGWAEGALKSAEMVLTELNMSPPDWVPRAAYGRVRCTDYSEYIES